MKERKTTKSLKKMDGLIDAVGTVLTENGHANISAGSISRLVGVNRRIIDFHFGSLVAIKDPPLRMSLSAIYTRQDLDYALNIFEYVIKKLKLQVNLPVQNERAENDQRSKENE